MACGQIPLTPTPPPVGLRPKSAALRPRMNERAYSIPLDAAPRAQCLCRRVSGTESDVRPGRHVRFCVARSAHREAENCAASPRPRAERANARNGRCFPPWVPGEPSGVRCWVRPQPELSLQLVYPWGVAVVCGLWQGTPGGFSRGLAEVPLSALLPPTSWARKKSARPPGRDPAISAAEGGTSGAARRGAKKAPPGAARQIQTVRRAANQKRNAAPGAAFLLAVRSPRQRV